MSDYAKILVEQFYGKVCDQSDREAAIKYIHSGVEFYASGTDTPVGFDDFFNYVSSFQKSLAFKHTIEETIVENEKVLIYWSLSGSHQKELFGYVPTCLPIKYTGMSLFYFKDNQIVKAITVFDEKTLIEQLSSSTR